MSWTDNYDSEEDKKILSKINKIRTQLLDLGMCFCDEDREKEHRKLVNKLIKTIIELERDRSYE